MCVTDEPERVVGDGDFCAVEDEARECAVCAWVVVEDVLFHVEGGEVEAWVFGGCEVFAEWVFLDHAFEIVDVCRVPTVGDLWDCACHVDGERGESVVRDARVGVVEVGV